MNRRTFLKSAVTTGAILTLNPFSAGKNENPLKWTDGEKQLPPCYEPILIRNKIAEHYRKRKYQWIQLEKSCWNRDTIQNEKRIYSEEILYAKILNLEEFRIPYHDLVHNKNYYSRCFTQPKKTPDYLIISGGQYNKPCYPKFIHDCHWIALKDLMKTRASGNMSLLTPGQEIILIEKYSKALMLINRDDWVEGYIQLQPCKIIGKRKKFYDGGTFVQVASNFSPKYYKRVSLSRSWIVLPTV